MVKYIGIRIFNDDCVWEKGEDGLWHCPKRIYSLTDEEMAYDLEIGAVKKEKDDRGAKGEEASL